VKDTAREHTRDSTPRAPRAPVSRRADPRVARVLALQRSAGNRAVVSTLRADPPAERVLQRKNPFKWAYKKIRNLFGGAPAAAVAPPVVAAPAPVAQVTDYPGSSVRIRDTGAYQNGNFTAKVTADLDQVTAAFGNAFMNAPNNKRQTIIYDNGLNYCRGGNAGYTELRDAHQGANRANFAQELQHAMTGAGMDATALATQLLNTQLPHWNNALTPSPFQADDQAGTEGKIAQWLAGTALPTADEVDVVCLVLEQWLRAGPGCGVIIAYDPDLVNAGAGAGNRPAAVALAHELTHAYYYARGTQLGTEDSSSELNGGRLFELMAVGMQPFNGRPYSENRMRATFNGVGPRVSYP
jgi:hypothetical protein